MLPNKLVMLPTKFFVLICIGVILLGCLAILVLSLFGVPPEIAFFFVAFFTVFPLITWWHIRTLRRDAQDPEVQAMYIAMMEKAARTRQFEENLLQAKREAMIAKARRGELDDDEEPRF